MLRTLIVEDNGGFRHILKESLLEHFPFMIIEESANGEESLNKIDAHPPELIIMDISLPGENGLNLTKKIKTLYPKIVIIILTNHDLLEYREVAYQYGAEHFLSKDSSTLYEIGAFVKSILSGMDIMFDDRKGG